MEIKGRMTKYSLQSSPRGKNVRRKWNLDRITGTKILKCFRTKTFKIEKLVILAEYFEHQTDCNRYRRKISKSRRSPSWRGISRVYISLSNKWKPKHGAINGRHVILRTALKRYFRFPRNCKQLGTTTVEPRNCIVRFIFQFSLKLLHTNWKIFSHIILGSIGRVCCKKIRVLAFLAKIFVF